MLEFNCQNLLDLVYHLQRLGKSMNKLEILLHERDYEVYYLRVQLEKALEEERLQEVEELLSFYESLSVAKENVHLQYLSKMKAVLSKKRGEGKLALSLFEKALKATLPWWKKGFREKETFSLKQKGIWSEMLSSSFHAFLFSPPSSNPLSPFSSVNVKYLQMLYKSIIWYYQEEC